MWLLKFVELAKAITLLYDRSFVRYLVNVVRERYIMYIFSSCTVDA